MILALHMICLNYVMKVSYLNLFVKVKVFSLWGLLRVGKYMKVVFGRLRLVLSILAYKIMLWLM